MRWHVKEIWSDEFTVTEEEFGSLLEVGNHLRREFLYAEKDEFFEGAYPTFIKVEAVHGSE